MKRRVGGGEKDRGDGMLRVWEAGKFQGWIYRSFAGRRCLGWRGVHG